MDVDPDTNHLAIYLLVMNPERGPRRCPPEVFLMLSLLLAFGGGLSVNDNGSGWAGLRPWGGNDRHMLGRLVTDAKLGQLAKQNPQPDHHSQHPVNFTRTSGRSSGGERPAGTPRRDREDAIQKALKMWDANHHRAGFTVSRAEYESTLTDNPKAARILDFVAGPESRGNYNAFYGNAGSTKDLGAMSLDQVMAWSGNRGTASSATGRYQFMLGTLRGLKQEMGLSGAEKFSPELQDKMALQLLERRGFSKWQAGQLSTEQFANNLALEWAALPNLIPQRGRGVGQSAYEGDGLNKALVTPGAVIAALGDAAGAPAASPRTGIGGMVSRLLGRRSPQQTASGASSGPAGPGDVYASIPDVDGAGRPGQRAKFLEWNPDPVGNNERNLQSINPSLASVIRKAQADNPALRFVVASGHRDEALQEKAVKWGWSKTNDSNHEHGDAADVWVLNDKGQVVFDQKLQEQAAAAIKKAAGELGTGVTWGGDFRTFKDRPHFELTKTRRA